MFVPLPVPFVLPRTASDLHAWHLKSPLALRSHSGKHFFQRNHPFFLLTPNPVTALSGLIPVSIVWMKHPHLPFSVCVARACRPFQPFSLVQPTRVKFVYSKTILRYRASKCSSGRVCFVKVFLKYIPVSLGLVSSGLRIRPSPPLASASASVSPELNSRWAGNIHANLSISAGSIPGPADRGERGENQSSYREQRNERLCYLNITNTDVAYSVMVR